MADDEERVDLAAETEQTAEETAPSPVEEPAGEGEGAEETKEEGEKKGEEGEKSAEEEGGAATTTETPEKKSAEDEAESAGVTPPPPPSGAAADSSSSKLKELTDDKGTNAKNLACERCQSVVLRPGLATVTQKEYFLPHMKVKSASQQPGDGEALRDFWQVQGMYTFENVGFTNTVRDIKYLICADCEVGPIGCHELKVKDHFYVAVDRVTYT